MEDTEAQVANRTIDFEQVWNLKREELKPEVRNYADNLHGQIVQSCQELGFERFGDFLKAVSERKVPVEKAKGVGERLARLREVVEIGEVPFDEEKFFEALDIVVDNWQQIRRDKEAGGEMRDFIDDEDLIIRREVFNLPELPLAVLVEDANFCQRLLERVVPRIDSDQKEKTGLVMSRVIGRSLMDQSSESLARVYQLIDLTRLGELDCIGRSFSGGNWEIKGKTGNYLGYQMTGEK